MHLNEAVPSRLKSVTAAARNLARGPRPLVVGIVAWTVLAAASALLGPVALAWGRLPCEPHGDPVLQSEWQSSPWAWTVACFAIVASILWAHWLGPRLVRLLAWVSLPVQAWVWYAALESPGWCN